MATTMGNLRTIIYVSHAVRQPTEPELEAILATSVRNNARDGITGALLHRDGNFIQVLEGEEASVRMTFERIKRDARHAGVTVLMDAPAVERAFPQWKMAHLQPTHSELLALATANWKTGSDAAPATESSGFVALKAFADSYRR